MNTAAIRLLALHLAGLAALLSGIGVLASHPTPGARLSPAAVRPAAPSTPPVHLAPTEPKLALHVRPSPLVHARQVLVVLGDSVPAGTACACAGFGTDLARAVEPAVLTNAAQDGLTSAGLLAQLGEPALVRALASATMVTVTIGANDFDESMAAEASCANASCYAATLQALTATMTQITARLAQLTPPGTTVVLTGYWNVFLDGDVGARHGTRYVATSDALTRQVNAAMAQVAGAGHTHYVNLYATFKGDGSRDDTQLLAPDGDHPDEAGHQLIAAAIATAADLSPLH